MVRSIARPTGAGKVIEGLYRHSVGSQDAMVAAERSLKEVHDGRVEGAEGFGSISVAVNLPSSCGGCIVQLCLDLARSNCIKYSGLHCPHFMGCPAPPKFSRMKKVNGGVIPSSFQYLQWARSLPLVERQSIGQEFFSVWSQGLGGDQRRFWPALRAMLNQAGFHREPAPTPAMQGALRVTSNVSRATIVVFAADAADAA